VEQPAHSVYVSAYYMDRYEVTKALWDDVANWATNNGYDIGANDGLGKAPNHPVQDVTWFECVKWCNARSEKEGRTPAYYTSPTNRSAAAVFRTGQKFGMVNDWVLWNGGYRLPTEAEWEKAGRGGGRGCRYSWRENNTIQHAQANYQATLDESYDISPTRGHHPAYNDGVKPYTSPVGSFRPNAYGLYDMTGNVWEWCWDFLGSNYYSSCHLYDPQGPTSGPRRVFRGGSWDSHANGSRIAWRYYFHPTSHSFYTGFRTVLPLDR
jgi:formylglycine-generating enzyme required for sulfatase activity